ncbi:DUF1064 domain-containing protein [Hydrogenimonas sp.]
MRRKYGNRKVVIDGIKFDSKKEAKRFGELVILAKGGKIEKLSLQPEFEIAGRVYDDAASRWLPARKYIADFKYFDNEKDAWIVEDVKSEITRKEKTYRLKRHLFLERYSGEFVFVEV